MNVRQGIKGFLISCTGTCEAHLGSAVWYRQERAAHLWRWRTRKASVSRLGCGRLPMVWYIRAMLLSSSETSEGEQRRQICQQGQINRRLHGFINYFKEKVSVRKWKINLLFCCRQIPTSRNTSETCIYWVNLFHPIKNGTKLVLKIFYYYYYVSALCYGASQSQTTTNNTSAFSPHTYRLPPWRYGWGGRWEEAPSGFSGSLSGGRWRRGCRPLCWVREQFCCGETSPSGPSLCDLPQTSGTGQPEGEEIS